MVVNQLEESACASTDEIYFLVNLDQLLSESLLILDAIAGFLKAHPHDRLIIEGHTDNVGGEAFNRSLSTRRAESVKTYPEEKHDISADRLEAQGYSLSKPVADNGSPQGRARNRRVGFATDTTNCSIDRL